MQLTPSQADALNIKKHVCVTAGAGSGKTTVLVERYLKILQEGNVTPREIVAITFTEKAAAEMKERVIERLKEEESALKPVGEFSKRAGEDQNTDRRESFLEQMNTAPISTIHAFCARILREFPFQAKVPANFSILQGIDQKLLLQQTVQKTLTDIATNPDDEHRDELTRLLQRHRSRQNLANLLFTMVYQRETIENLKQEIYNHQNDAEIREAWEQRIAMELVTGNEVDEWIPCLNAVLEIAKGGNAEEVRALTNQLVENQKARTAVSAVLEILAKIAVLITTKDGKIAKMKFFGRSVNTTGFEAETDFLVSAAKKINAIPPLNEDDDFLIATIRALLILYERIKKTYQHEKLSQGKLDYTDLQLETRDLLQSNEEIRQKLSARYAYYMVDEYQDTNRLQSKLIALLTDNLRGANLFIVGDEKQGIYGFRGADIQVFNETRERICDLGGEAIGLRENFRSLQDVVGFVNFFFHSLMGNGGESEFEVSYESLIRARTDDAAGAVEIILSDKNMEQEGDAVVNENALVANRIKRLKAKGVKYGDIAILIRSRTHLPDIERALLEEGVPYLTTGGIGFYQRQEIYDIWNYLQFLDAPTESHVSLAAILRGPCFGISDAELYDISQQQGKSLWDKVQEYLQQTATASDPLKTAIASLKKHRRLARRLPVNQLILTIVNETGMIGTLKTGKQGHQRWANYQKLLELARNFEGDVINPEGGQTLASFIKFLDILIDEEPREGQAPIERSEAAVNIMTIHAAKGLEFPVVILPSLERGAQSDREPFIDELLGIGFSPLNPDNGYLKSEPSIVKFMKSRAKAKAEAEKKRLFYVGATRAENRLILSGTRDKNPSNFLKWLYEHLGIEGQEALRLPVRLEVLSNNNPSSETFELSIPIIRELESIAPGDEISDESPPVEFPEPPRPALTPQPIEAHFSVTELSNYARCPMRYQLENVLRIPTTLQGEVVHNPAAALDWDETELDAAVRRILARIKQPSDLQKLDTLILEASQDDRVEMPTALKVSAAEREKTLRKHVYNFLNSEIGVTALAASESYTNQYLHAEIEGHVIEGSLDRRFKDETGHWHVITYKTGEARELDAYCPEMELYSLLVHRCYPEQFVGTLNTFFTEHERCAQMHLSATELQETKERWKQRISALQRGVYEKNTKHCKACPYADSNKQCIITES